jgi:hypothetical protein
MAEKRLEEKLNKFFQHRKTQHARMLSELRAQEEADLKVRDERRESLIAQFRDGRETRLNQERVLIERWRATVDKQRTRQEGERKFRETQELKRMKKTPPVPLPDEIFVSGLPADSGQDTAVYMGRLRENRVATEKAKEEHEKRRRGVLVEQQEFREMAEQEEHGNRLTRAARMSRKCANILSDKMHTSTSSD